MSIPSFLYGFTALLCVLIVVDYFTSPQIPWLRTVNMIFALIIGVVLLVLFTLARVG